MAQEEVILTVNNLSLSFGGVKALIDLDFAVKKGEILAIVGPNGAGKTSLINCISGFYRPNSGAICFEGRDVTGLRAYKLAELGIARTFQNIALFTEMTVLDNLLAGRHIHFRTDFMSGAIFLGRARREEVKHRKIVEEIIEFLDLAPIRKKIVGTLPYGLRKRVELGRALALNPKLILLDEPMAGMNIEEKEEMVKFILDTRDGKGCTMVFVEHDMGVVIDISDRTIVLDFGQKIAEGLPEEVVNNPHVIKVYLGEDHE